MAFEIIVHEAAVEELEALRVFDQRIIVDALPDGANWGRLPSPLKMYHPFGNCALGIFGYSTMWIRRRITFTFGQLAAKNLRNRPRT